MTRWRSDIPFNELPNLPPNINDIDTKAILKQCIKARAALAELKQAADLIPNQSMLINTLPIMEAQASSEIENIVTTTDKLFQYMGNESDADPATKEALRYRRALLDGFNHIRQKPLCVQTAQLVCSTIKNSEMDIRKVSGTTLQNGVTRVVIYTPPEGESIIRDKLSNWEKFIHEFKDVDPLVVMAIAHYQFEAIHPFSDGNGRTGRVLNSLFFIEKELLNLPVLYLSRYIINNKTDYYRLLLEVTSKQTWEEWILYMLKGVEETAIWTVKKIRAVRLLLEHTKNYVRSTLPKIYTGELVDILFSQPYVRIVNLEENNIAKRQTGSKYLQEMVKIGILRELISGRDKVFSHPKLIKLLLESENTFEKYDYQE